jgi:hypothetical protein
VDRIYKVKGRVANNSKGATVRIKEVGGDRYSGDGRVEALFSVRPHRSRDIYELPLSTVADMVCWKVASLSAQAPRS